MKKFRFYINFNKEEKWLNEMGKLGWELSDKNINYEFSKTSPQNTVIKIDYRNFKSDNYFQDYILMFKDFGWGHIAGKKNSGKQYFKKIDDKAGADIFSDVNSKAERYKKLSNMWLTLAMCYVPIFISLITTKVINVAAFLNPKLFYYTSGLWEKTGEHFWKAFLFETPFVIMRGFFWLFFPLIIILYSLFALKAQKYYKKTNIRN
ncbi:DUF2812 domain-containing protein [Clostridium weizhouense]|uniref:DUF2812 domain-containing protein n=1 Tax=Clostridium weizhouense TaxID=2859781 RepID=A0ABS7AR13_9CLOT|nr:DUF2812 domain-containing protein [Clostridium weizhouense]MBW6410846.1 DUF2812 domain-containing protein [Clostridium weizhouense]